MRAARMPIGIEALHPMFAADRACVNTLRQALDFCARIDPSRSGMLGVVLDVYQVWWDFELFRQIERCGRDRLLDFHVCDWLAMRYAHASIAGFAFGPVPEAAPKLS